MGVLFQRKKNLIIKDRLYTYPQFEIQFSGEFDDEPEPDTYIIDIYNLSIETINSIEKGDFVSLSAGYDEDVGTVVVGYIKNVYTIKRSADILTTMEVQNIGSDWLKRSISLTLNGPVQASTVLAEIGNIAGIEISIVNLVNDVIYQNGKTIYGPIQDVTKKIIVTDCQSNALFQDAKIIATDSQKGFETAFVLSKDSGLIGIPRKLNSEDDDGDYQVSCLFNQNIRLRSLVQIESQIVSGTFMVVEGIINKDFTMNLKVIAK